MSGNERFLVREAKQPEHVYDNVAIDIDDKPPPPPTKPAEEVVRTARNAFTSGRTKSLKFRKLQLKNFLKMLEENEKVFFDALWKDLRRHEQETSVLELEYTKNELRNLLWHLEEYCSPEKPSKPILNLLDGVYVYKDPYGVVLVMGAWNYPVQLTLTPAAGAIAAGNCVVLKPSELAPATAEAIATLLPKYLDESCYQVYLGGVSETSALLEQRFDYIFFTGSTTVGKIIHKAASKHLTPVTLELGGKSPVYVDATADVATAVKRILWGKCINAGQTCVAPDYVLCTRQVQERILKTAPKVIREFYGSDVKASKDYARIVSDRHFDRLSRFLDGRKPPIGGTTDPKDRFIHPTVIPDVNPNDPIMQEEIFGPILPIIPIETLDEAIRFINAREKPLALYIFTEDSRVTERILRDTSSGGVTVNDTIMHLAVEALPFGGVGESGMGNYHGKRSFDCFVHHKSVLKRDLGAAVEKAQGMRYPPYTSTKMGLLNFAMKKRKALVSGKVAVNVVVFGLGVAAAFGGQFLYGLLEG